MILFYCVNTGPVKCHCVNTALAYTIALEFSPTHQWTWNSHIRWGPAASQGRVQPYLPVYQQQSVHHKRRVYAAHIGDTPGAFAGSQMKACCWAPWDISYISHFSKT